ncbi:MAG TPA: hypothetical protein VL461_12995 [Dictyobacter sp.]|jgi:hypothetical protein|nr:hypothetical protein [Dictyobacter sp.]
MYHYMDHKEAVNMLRRAGFKHTEIDRVIKFRRHFAVSELDQAADDQRRLEFVRWLFRTGKLSDSVR